MQKQINSGRVLKLENYKIQYKLQKQDIECKTDKAGKFRIWMRVNQNLVPESSVNSTAKILYFPVKRQK